MMNWWKVKLKLGYKNYIEYHQAQNKSHAEFKIIEKYGTRIARKGVYEDMETNVLKMFRVEYILRDSSEHVKLIMAVDEDHAKTIVYSDHPKGRIAEMKISNGKKQLVNE